MFWIEIIYFPSSGYKFNNKSTDTILNDLAYQSSVLAFLAHGLDGQQWETFLQTAQEVGFTHPRLYRVSKIVFNDKMKKDVGGLVNIIM